jgi:opacity protein-like surface antigen
MKKVYLLLAAFCAVALTSNAKALAASSSADEAGWVCQASIGHAWSRDSGVVNPDTAVFTNAVETTLDDAKLGKSSFVGLSLDKNLWSWLSAGVSYDMYSGFKYNAHHETAVPLTATGVENLSIKFNRSFNVSHQAALFNVNFMLPESWAVSVADMNISPVLGAGVGVGISEVSNFQALTAAGNVATYAAPNSKADLAYQMNGGLMFQPEDGNVRFGVNYRYYNGGKFESAASYMFNDSNNNGTLVPSKAWTGKLKAHQVRLCLDFEF